MTDTVIAGAGIGGLTAALALHRVGISVTVVERATQLRAIGVGINLLPHAVRELDVLGVGDALAEIAVAPHSIQFHADDGRLLLREPRGLDGGYGHPQLSVHRGTLQMILLDAVRDRIGASAVRTGLAVTNVTDLGERVSVRTGDHHEEADVLVGADGIGSAVRRLLHTDADPLRWSGVTMYRGAASTTPFLDGATMAIVKGRNGVELVTYPIGRGLVNWVLMAPVAAGGALPRDAGWNEPADQSDVLSLIAGWRLGWLDVTELIEATDDVFRYPMVDRDPLPFWGRGRVTLLGDAAHPMYPVGANGGSQAIVDAMSLATNLSRADDVVAGLRAYEAERRPLTADVVWANRRMHERSTADPAGLAAGAADYRRDTHADPMRGA